MTVANSRLRTALVVVWCGLATLTGCSIDPGVATGNAIRTADAAPTGTTMPRTPADPDETTMPPTDQTTPSTTSSTPTVAQEPPPEAPPAWSTRWLCVALLGLAACTGDGGEAEPTPPTEPAVCEVTDLLVPTCGAWFGVSSPSSDGAFDYTRGFAEYATVVAEPPDILRFYQRDDEVFPDAEHRALAERDGEPRSLLHFSWKPSTTLTWREIADGGAEASIDAVAASLSAYPHRMFLTIHHEPENDIGDDGSGMTAADYVDMYRHVVSGLRERGVDNVVYVMSYIGFERWVDVVDDLYPGDDVVDWIAWDPYAVGEIDSFADLVNSPSDGWPGFYEWATAKAPGTPLMLAEWGFNLPRQTWATEVLDDAPEVLRTRFPALKALVYWNDLGDRFDSRLTTDGDDRSEFSSTFAELATDPYFNRVSTDDAP